MSSSGTPPLGEFANEGMSKPSESVDVKVINDSRLFPCGMFCPPS